MIAVDTSAIVAVAKREAGYEAFLRALLAVDCLIGAPTVLECSMVLTGGRLGQSALFLDELLRRRNVTIVPFGGHHVGLAREAFEKYGKGRGSGAGLNFGDCISYAVAKHENAPLLFSGNDFLKSDIVSALNPG